MRIKGLGIRGLGIRGLRVGGLRMENWGNEDGVHPSALGHDMIATQILQNWKHLLSSF